MKIAIIGGGSFAWTPTIFRDIIVTEALEGASLVLEDINTDNLKELTAFCQKALKEFGKDFKLVSTTNQAEALQDADYVILTISVGGYDTMEHDLEIPYKYDIYQPVGDTVGPGGLSRALRSVPVVLDIAKEMEKLCPHAWLINLSNPMAPITRVANKHTSIRCLGLCHELFGMLGRLQKIFDLEDWRRDITVTAGGVNHFLWITDMRIKGEDGLEMLRKYLDNSQKDLAGKADADAVARTDPFASSDRLKFQLFKLYGCLPVAGDRHVAEFFPYFTGAEVNKGADFGVKLTTIQDRRQKWLPRHQKFVRDYLAGNVELSARKSSEAVSNVIASLATGQPLVDIMNLPNRGQIDNLPRETVVETLASVRQDTVQGLSVGNLPEPIVGWVALHAHNHEMAVEAALDGDRRLALEVLLNDPLTRSFKDAPKMLEELLEANRDYLPRFFS